MKKTTFATIAAVTIMSAPVLRARAVPGDQRRWALDFRVRLDQARGGRPIEMELRGDWLSTIVALRPGEYDAALQLADGRMAGAGGHLPPGVGRTFWATYREDGTLLAFHFYKDVDPSTRNLLQMIAGEMQLVEAGSSKTAWTETERDSAGEYLAIYNRLDSNRVVKRKVKYIYTDGATGAPENGLRVEIDESELCFTLAPEGQILSLEGRNRVRIGVPLADAGQLPALAGTRLSDPRTATAPELIGSLARALPQVTSGPVVTARPDPVQVQTEHDGRLLEGRTTESLLAAATAMRRPSDDRAKSRTTFPLPLAATASRSIA